MKLYHGTQVQNIDQLKPFATRDNAIIKVRNMLYTKSLYCSALYKPVESIIKNR